MSDLAKIGETHLQGTVQNPFAKNHIKNIMVRYCQRTFDPGVWYAYGIVEFKSGNTSGEQRFDGDTFDDVVALIKQFIEKEL